MDGSFSKGQLYCDLVYDEQFVVHAARDQGGRLLAGRNAVCDASSGKSHQHNSCCLQVGVCCIGKRSLVSGTFAYICVSATSGEAV